MAVSAVVLYPVSRYPDHAALMAVATVALLAAGWAVLARPAFGACVLIVLIYWNLSNVVTDTWSFTWLLKLAIVGVVAAWMWQRSLAPVSPSWHWPLALPMAAYGVVLAVSAVRAADPAAALAFLQEFIKGVVVFYLVANLLARPRYWRWGLGALMTGLAALALPVAYQGVTGSRDQFWGLGIMKYAEISPGNWGWRLGGAIGDPNFLAMVLVAALPVAVVAGLESGAPRWRRVLGWMVAALTVVATAFTYSRASLLGFGLVAGAVLWKYRRRRWLAPAAVLTLLASLPMLPGGLTARLATLSGASLNARAQNLSDASIRIRRNAYWAGLLMFRDHPLLGVGPGNYEADYLKYSALVGTSDEDTVRDPHSLPIQIAAETGLAGLITFAGLIWAYFVLAERGRHAALQRGARSFADWIWSLEISVASYLLLSCFLHGAYFRHFWLLMALGATGATLALEAARAHARGTFLRRAA